MEDGELRRCISHKMLAFEGGISLIQEKAKGEKSGMVWVVKGAQGLYLNNKKCHCCHAIRPKVAPPLKYRVLLLHTLLEKGLKFWKHITIHVIREWMMPWWRSACNLKFEFTHMDFAVERKLDGQGSASGIRMKR